jgi:hypothetical protein
LLFSSACISQRAGLPSPRLPIVERTH